MQHRYEYKNGNAMAITIPSNEYYVKQNENDYLNSKEISNEEMILKAIENNPFIIIDIPEEYITPRVASKVIDKNPDHIIHLPKDNHELFSEDICLKVINHNNNLIEYIPEECITTRIGLIAFNKRPNNIIYFPKNNPDLFKEEMILKAIECNPFIVIDIPKEYITQRIASKLIDIDPNNIIYLPEDNHELFSEDICLKVIEHDHSLIKYIPEECITTRVGLVAFDKNSDNIIYLLKK